jgi:hypothetical protein
MKDKEKPKMLDGSLDSERQPGKAPLLFQILFWADFRRKERIEE